ncbi:hypothetical protein ACPW96_20270 [Micromonospora sp. DT81.3]|uniref:hypothetical protein n=1 Tax=Micromonospora sp. DT81.3 TaxID=3416523 RepID=UPI003CFA1F80
MHNDLGVGANLSERHTTSKKPEQSPTFEECLAEAYAEYVRSWLDERLAAGSPKQ